MFFGIEFQWKGGGKRENGKSELDCHVYIWKIKAESNELINFISLTKQRCGELQIFKEAQQGQRCI